MKFSVVIPLYNKEQYILRAVSSILNQTYRDFELIVIDDGSVDDGPNLVARVRDPRIRIVRQKNGGEAAARNRGIEEAGERYIAFLDADDAWEESHLSTLAQLISDFPDAGIYCTGYRFIEPSGKIKEPSWFDVPSRGYVQRYFHSVSGGDMVATASSVCISREVFQQVGHFPRGDQLGADQDMWARVALRYPLAVDARPTATYFRDASNRSCINLKHEGELPYITRLQSALDTTYLPDEVRKDIEAYIRQGLFSLISVNVRNGRFKAAQQLLQDSRLQGIGLRLRIWTLLAKLPPSLSDLTLRTADFGRAACRSIWGVAGRNNA
jgi:glycosyltransferase involved in cell wall biosynthesis